MRRFVSAPHVIRNRRDWNKLQNWLCSYSSSCFSICYRLGGRPLTIPEVTHHNRAKGLADGQVVHAYLTYHRFLCCPIGCLKLLLGFKQPYQVGLVLFERPTLAVTGC